MAVFDIADFQQEQKEEQPLDPPPSYTSKKDKFISSLLARGLFFLLFLADIAWCIYSFVLFTAALFAGPLAKTFRKNRALSFKRSLICALSLFTAIFSPPIGIMFGCTYFMVFDKAGIDEVVPSSLKSQFDEFFPG